VLSCCFGEKSLVLITAAAAALLDAALSGVLQLGRRPRDLQQVQINGGAAGAGSTEPDLCAGPCMPVALLDLSGGCQAPITEPPSHCGPL